MNITEVDSITDLLNNDNPNYNSEFLDIHNQIKSQYIDFEGVGVDLLSDLSVDKQIIVLKPMIEYIHYEIIPLLNFDIMQTDVKSLVTLGTYIYSFYCVDLATSLIPHLLTKLKIESIIQFDKHVNLTIAKQPEKLKTDTIYAVSEILTRLNNLKSIDTYIKNDGDYKKLIEKYSFYYELINFSDINILLIDVIRVMFRKNIESILWRI